MEHLDERLRAWSRRRQRLGGAGASTPAEALHDVIGVASSHPSGPLSLLARCPDMDAAGFRSLDRDRLALRLPAMRMSVHMVPIDLADEVFAATCSDLRTQLWRLGRVGLDLDGYRRARNDILEVSRTPASSGEIRAATGLPGATVTGVIQTMTFEGVLLRIPYGSLRETSLKYVATDAWLGRRLQHHDGDPALVNLARQYLHAFGPARVADLAWWSGRPAHKVAEAVADLDVIEIGDGLLLAAADEDAFASTAAPDDDHIDVLPARDPYTMGYAPDGRLRFVDAHHLERLYDDVGNGLGAVLRGGRVMAAWSASMDGFWLRVEIDAFQRIRPDTTDVLEARFEGIAELIDADGATLVIV